MKVEMKVEPSVVMMVCESAELKDILLAHVRVEMKAGETASSTE